MTVTKTTKKIITRTSLVRQGTEPWMTRTNDGKDWGGSYKDDKDKKRTKPPTNKISAVCGTMMTGT